MDRTDATEMTDHTLTSWQAPLSQLQTEETETTRHPMQLSGSVGMVSTLFAGTSISASPSFSCIASKPHILFQSQTVLLCSLGL